MRAPRRGALRGEDHPARGDRAAVRDRARAAGRGGRLGGRERPRAPWPARARRAASARRLQRLPRADRPGARAGGRPGRAAGEPDRGAAGRLAADLARAAGLLGMRPAVQALVVPARRARSSTSATATPTAAARSPPTGSSPGAGWRPTSRSRASPTSRSTTCTPLLLRFPEPYDFEISTERFRAFGPDVANLWHEGGLHRVVGGREVRIEAAPGGVRVSPHSRAIEREVRMLLGEPFDLDAFYRWSRRADPVVRRLAKALAGFRPPLAPDPFEMLVGVDLGPAGLALRRLRDSQPLRRALRRAGRARSRVPDARAGRAREGGRARRARLLAPQGRVRRRSRPVRARPRRRSRRCRTRR